MSDETGGGRPDKKEEEEAVDAEGYRELMPGIKYKETVEGRGPQAEYKQAVICSVEGRYGEVVFEKEERKMLRVGDGDVPPGLELALRQLREGTECEIKAEWRFAYGDGGRPGSDEEKTEAVPARTDVEWSVKCHRLWLKEADEQMSPADALVDARNKKTLGNEHFHHDNWRKAASNYQEILKNLNPWNYEGDERDEAETIYVDCGNNVVFALMKLDEYLKAEKAVCDVLTVAPENRKALYRATQIALHLSKWPEATAALKLALDKWPNSKDFRQLYQVLRDHKKKYKQRKAKMSQQIAKQLLDPDSDSGHPTAHDHAADIQDAADFSIHTTDAASGCNYPPPGGSSSGGGGASSSSPPREENGDAAASAPNDAAGGRRWCLVQ